MTHSQNRSQWYLAQIRPNRAHIAKRNLERQGFATFLPLEKLTAQRKGQFVARTRPYFPGYLFVEIHEANAHWRAIRSTNGVSKLVSFGDAPAPVPPGVVEILLDRADRKGVLEPRGDVTTGDTVRISDGPFHDFLGKVESLTGDQRIWVLLDIMGKQTRVNIERAKVRAL